MAEETKLKTVNIPNIRTLLANPGGKEVNFLAKYKVFYC